MKRKIRMINVSFSSLDFSNNNCLNVTILPKFSSSLIYSLLKLARIFSIDQIP